MKLFHPAELKNILLFIKKIQSEPTVQRPSVFFFFFRESGLRFSSYTTFCSAYTLRNTWSKQCKWWNESGLTERTTTLVHGSFSMRFTRETGDLYKVPSLCTENRGEQSTRVVNVANTFWLLHSHGCPQPTSRRDAFRPPHRGRSSHRLPPLQRQHRSPAAKPSSIS